MHKITVFCMVVARIVSTTKGWLIAELLASMEVVWNGCEHQAFSNRKSHKPDIHSWFFVAIGNESQSINYGNVSTTRKSSGVHSTRRQGKLFEQQEREVERPLLDVGSIAFVLSTTSLHLRVYKSWSNVTIVLECKCYMH